MICPYCKSEIPDLSDECFVCGADLLPKSVSEYYTDMDGVKEVDENLYKEINKKRGTDDDALTPAQKRGIVIAAAIGLILALIALDVFQILQYNIGAGYEKKRAYIVGVHYIAKGRTERDNLTTDCMVAYPYNDEVLNAQVKAGFHYCIGDQITVYVGPDGKAYHFAFSLGDILQLIIIACFTALTIIAIARWNKGPNADGHLDRRMPGYNMGSNMQVRRNKKWWRYF